MRRSEGDLVRFRTNRVVILQINSIAKAVTPAQFTQRNFCKFLNTTWVAIMIYVYKYDCNMNVYNNDC